MQFITYGTCVGWLPWVNVSASGEHLHFCNFDIATLAGIGLVAMLVTSAYGAGTALITEEFALLLDARRPLRHRKAAPVWTAEPDLTGRGHYYAYSALMASSGPSLAARRAGHTAASMPITPASRRNRAMRSYGIFVVYAVRP